MSANPVIMDDVIFYGGALGINASDHVLAVRIGKSELSVLPGWDRDDSNRSCWVDLEDPFEGPYVQNIVTDGKNLFVTFDSADSMHIRWLGVCGPAE
jgi:hypothetical protein